jgi:SAM-dependent methyltransferase
MSKTPYRYIPYLSETIRFIRRQIDTVRFSGNDLYCPVCNKSWNKSKPQDICPHCRSATRHKALVIWLSKYLEEENRNLETLLFAPDPGVENWLRRQTNISLTTTDYSAPKVDHHWDITDIPASVASYDLVLCSHVMEHVPNDAKAFSELARILRPDGVLVLQVPYARDCSDTDEDPSITDPEERTRRFGQFDHVRRYGRDIVKRMEQNGLITDVIAVDSFISPDDMVYFDMWNDVIFASRRFTEDRKQGDA